MKKAISLLAFASAFAVHGEVGAVDNNYDMSIFLNQKHPFLVQTQTPVSAARPATLATQNSGPVNPAQQKRPAPKTVSVSQMAEIKGPMARQPWGGFVSEVRIGALAHDVGPFSSKKESGIDTNLEVLFASPDFFDLIWSPRPQVGLSYNSSGDTSLAYLGLEWEYGFLDGWFASFSFGGAGHDGHLVGDKDDKTDKKSLGCRFLFREALNVGYRFGGQHAVMIQLDHVSNASLCEKEVDNEATGLRHTVTLNEGLESVGVRYGYLF